MAEDDSSKTGDEASPSTDWYKRGKGVKRGELEEQLKFRSIWAWMWYKVKTVIYKFFPVLTLIAVIVLVILAIIWAVSNWALIETIGTRSEVGLEQSGIPGKIIIGIRQASDKLVDWVTGFGKWESPAREEREPRGIKIVEFGARDDFPYRVGEKIETVAEVKVYALDEEGFGTNKITFSCEYEDGESGEIVVEGLVNNEVYASSNREENYDIKCILPAATDEKETSTKDVNFYASYEDFITTSTLHASILGEDEYRGLEREGKLYDFLKENSAYPNLITRERKGISEYTNGPVKLAIMLSKLPLTENRQHQIGIALTPEISDWMGKIELKGLEFIQLPDVFEISNCNFGTDGRWYEEDLIGCNDGCERFCDLNVISADQFLLKDIKATATYDYLIETTALIYIRNETAIA